jgi:hypothetical protein
MKRTLVLCMALAALASACGSVPFRETDDTSFTTVDPRTAVEQFKETLPESFHLLNSIVFEYNWFSLSGLGYVDVAARDRTYKVACLNHLGVKIFEFEGGRSGVTKQYAIGPLANEGIADAVALDIQRIYLDLLPSGTARLIKRRSSFVYRQRSGWGALEYVFGNAGGELTRKTYFEDNRAVWRASYYEYAMKNGKRYPLGIVFDNFRFGYRLIVRQKEIRS